MPSPITISRTALDGYPDVYTPEALATLEALASLDGRRMELMHSRIDRRRRRAADGEHLSFLPETAVIDGTTITVADARAGRFEGAVIPHDLQRQWIQGTGPATRPRASTALGLRNVAYALLSGADGWMFDGEDALGQVDTMSLDNIRNIKLAFAGDPQFHDVAEVVAREMNNWAVDFHGREIIADWHEQLEVTTRIFRARGLHLDDRHIAHQDGHGYSASMADATLYLANNAETLRGQGRSVVLYLPKIQTASEAAHWATILDTIEDHLRLDRGTVVVYVLVEQLEACYQLMEIRAALGRHFVGFNTGRWDYINSVSDALAWDPDFLNPNIDAITMTYGYMRVYEDRVRRAVNTPDLNGHYALWQGGMEANIPVGSDAAVDAAMQRAVSGGGASRSRAPLGSGWPTGRWCTSCGRCGRRWETTTSSAGRSRPSLTRRRTPPHSGRSRPRPVPFGVLAT